MLPPVQDILRLAPNERPAWAVFDAAWYLQRYQEARLQCKGNVEVALNYYLAVGSNLAHSPSSLFDEPFYRSKNPDVAELIKIGNYRSGFDHFCQHGHRSLSPHWLFDDQFYAKRYDDMSIENLDQHGFAGRYDHYLKSGQFENRQAHFMFDSSYYRQIAILAGTPDSEIGEFGPYLHYLRQVGLGAAELPPSIYFEPQWYLETSIGVRSEMARNHFNSAIQHYLCNDAPELRDPVPQFSEAYYSETNPDVSSAIRNGSFRMGYEHFVQFGAFELRRPRPDIDLVYYRDINADVRDDLNTGVVRDAFAHLRLVGMLKGLAYFPPEAALEITEVAAKNLFIKKARDQITLFSRQSLDFNCTIPDISVIMVVFNKFELTMNSLASLRRNFPGRIELIIIDNASSDQTKQIERYVEGAVIQHFPENIGFLRAANLALEKVTASAVLYINNDIELGHEAIRYALARLRSAENIGAVGGKIIRSHGVLQEAGSIIWKDGSVTGYMRDASPTAPEVNFVRDVDYCSGVFLMCRSNILRSLGGFDDRFSPSYYEDVDLCVQIASSGYKVVYDPSITVYHLEYGSANLSESSVALMRRGQKIFQQKHEIFLTAKHDRSNSNLKAARSPKSETKHILFLEDTVPLRRLGSGFVRSNDIVREMADAGYQVTVFPINGSKHELIEIFSDFPDSIEIIYDKDINSLNEFLSNRLGYYDIIWVSRTHNLNRILPIFSEFGIAPGNFPFVLDTEAIVANRNVLKAALKDDHEGFDLAVAIKSEISIAKECRHVIAVNELEANQLRDAGLKATPILGTARNLSLSEKNFASRDGLLFVGSIHELDSPNLDSLYWYLNEILPILRRKFEKVPVLHVVGYTHSDIDLSAFANHPDVIIHGAVNDLYPYYNDSRVFIAPTRFAAGTPYKIYEAASFGLPCVTTDLLSSQLGWDADSELLVAPSSNATFFASQIIKLYQNEDVWKKVRVQAAQRLATENTASGFRNTLRDILRSALDVQDAAIPLGPCRKSRPARKSVPV